MTASAIATSANPHNPITGKEYTGGNVERLLDSGFASNAFATYRQWQSKGMQVQKGSKGIKIGYMRERTADECKNKKGEIDGNKLGKSIVRAYTVFAREQVEPVGEPIEDMLAEITKPAKPEPKQEAKPVDKGLEFVKSETLIVWSENGTIGRLYGTEGKEEAWHPTKEINARMACETVKVCDRDGGYDKTKFRFRVHTANGEAHTYEGRIDLGTDTRGWDNVIEKHIIDFQSYLLKQEVGHWALQTEEARKDALFWIDMCKASIAENKV